MKNELLSLLNKNEQQYVKGYAIDKGRIIFKEGETCSSVGIVLSGKIDIVSFSYKGKEIIYNSLRSGSIFGQNLIFSNSPYYKGDVIAKDKSIIALIKKEDLLTLFQTNKSFLEKYLSLQSEFAKSLNSTIKLLSFDNAEERFTYYLHKNNGQITIKSVTALAETLRVQRETMSRLIKKMQDMHRIKKVDKVITLLKK